MSSAVLVSLVRESSAVSESESLNSSALGTVLVGIYFDAGAGWLVLILVIILAVAEVSLNARRTRMV